VGEPDNYSIPRADSATDFVSSLEEGNEKAVLCGARYRVVQGTGRFVSETKSGNEWRVVHWTCAHG